MFWIKLLILNLILITSTIIGITFSKKYAYRVKELQEMKNALNIFMTKIKFTYEPIPSTFMYISEKVEGNVCKIFKNAVAVFGDEYQVDIFISLIDRKFIKYS